MITWSNDWISENESLWSILAKFKVANAVDSIYIKNQYIKRTPALLNGYLLVFLPDNFDYSAFSEQLGFNLIHYFEKQIDYLGISNVNLCAIKELFANYLRYCPLCIKSGYHSNLHQLKNINFCPFHITTELRETCAKCSLPINLYNATIDYVEYSCKCGKSLAKSNDFSVMKDFWYQAGKKNIIEKQFSEKQYIIIVDPLSGSFNTHNNFHENNINHSYRINNAHKNSFKRGKIDSICVYKCFLRRIRRGCLKKCIKKHYKQGLTANLCVLCRAYIKLRKQFELIKTDWDLYYAVGGMTLNPRSSILLDTSTLANIKSHLKLADLSDLATFNIRMYVLFQNLKLVYYNWITYIDYRCLINDMKICFSVSSIYNTDLNLKIQKYPLIPFIK